jgi:DNA-binding HxlR family transcriptional regulator
MKTYGQFCPIARASEILAERWTLIIFRNLFLGCTTFNEIDAGAPLLSRTLLTKRLRDLERAGVIEIRPKPGGHGSVYELTQAGRELQAVLHAIGGWADKWMDVTFEHSDPDVVLWHCGRLSGVLRNFPRSGWWSASTSSVGAQGQALVPYRRQGSGDLPPTPGFRRGPYRRDRGSPDIRPVAPRLGRMG